MEVMKSAGLFLFLVISIGTAAAQFTVGSKEISSVFQNELALDPSKAASAPVSYVIAHFPYGGGWSSRVLVANNSSTTTATVDVTFYNQAGAGFSVPLEGQAGLQATQHLVIPPKQVKVFGAVLNQRTTGNLQVAWATANTTAPVNVFSLFDFGTSTVIGGAVGAQATAPAKSFRFPVSVGGPLGYNAGMALANSSGTPTTVQVNVLNADGSLKGSFQETLQQGNQQTIFVLTAKGIAFNLSTVFDGTVVVCATQPIGLTTVGFEGGQAYFTTSTTNEACTGQGGLSP
jgi:hypothetical protein